MVPGDTFVFAGEVLSYEALVEDEVYVSRAHATEPKVPSYDGGKFPLSTYLADRVRDMLADPETWRALPDQVREWLQIQRMALAACRAARDPGRDLSARRQFISSAIRSRGGSRIRTLGMLLTRRLERARLRPLGFVANEYALAVWGLRDLGD